jgi:hypothetical protein
MLYLNKTFKNYSLINNSTLLKNFTIKINPFKFSKLSIKNFTSEATSENNNQQDDSQLNQLKQLSEFKSGMNSLAEGNLAQAEYHLKECLKIFKSINQTNTVSYIYILKKYSQVLFYSKKFEDCEKTINASVELAKELFKNNKELVFPYYRNLIAFYTHTDINKASHYIDKSEEELLDNPDRKIKILTVASGAIKLLNGEYNVARDKMNQVIGFDNISSEYKAYNLHNLAVLNSELKKDYEIMMQSENESEEASKNFLKKFNLNPDLDLVDKECILLYKQALAELEMEVSKNNPTNRNKIERTDEESNMLKHFLLSQNEVPKKEQEDAISFAFKNNNSGLTITNIAEMYFEKGKDYEKQTAFWLKTGLKHYEKYEKENIARHLIIFSLFYSQLGQTMYAEGLYRKSIEMLKNNLLNNMNYNLVFAMNMYGRLLLRQPNREKEANGNIKFN